MKRSVLGVLIVARLALQEAGGTAGGRPVRLVTLNDATNRAGSWVPERVVANARRAARDDSSVGYIGDLNSGASAVSLPVLNEAGIPMISPGNTYVGLTVKAPGSGRGEPEKYYPTNVRTYFRLLPNDTVQAAALSTAMRDDGIAELGFADPREGGVPSSVGRRVTVAVATLAPGAYNAPNVFARNRDPYTSYGYEAMKLILDGLNAGGASKEGVLGFLRGVQNRASVLGPYSFDANGDTTLRTYGLYTIRSRSLRWVGVVTAA